uniref:G-protein coupled receptors family 1 profile domain-containing protein n=1 Tax=Erpetoichthys calabaricus TaxID=27687 RepID=A0A8C4RH31_ERPCA
MGLKEAEQVYCPHPENTTCSLQNPSLAASIILYTIFMTGIILATFGNLVVSIAHFKQLHTPTNVLTLSMAVTDFLIGIFIMPIKLIQTMDKCWDLGVHTCMAGVFCYSAITTISVTHLIFLSVDRYYAVCNPLHYSTKITVGRAWVFAAICWICSICYNVLLFYVVFTFLFSDKNDCLGFCFFVTKLTLLIKGFTERQNKATVTVGVVIGTFVLFLSQFYIFILLSVFIKVSPLALNIAEYLVLFNFALNPLIYGLFYPWFRKGFKLIITCKIFKPDSSLINFLPSSEQHNLVPCSLSLLHYKKKN